MALVVEGTKEHFLNFFKRVFLLPLERAYLLARLEIMVGLVVLWRFLLEIWVKIVDFTVIHEVFEPVYGIFASIFQVFIIIVFWLEIVVWKSVTGKTVLEEAE